VKNIVFWNTVTQFILHRKHITSLLQSPAGYCYVRFYVRFEVFTEVTVKNVVFWNTETQFILHRKHIMSLLQSPAGYCYVRFEVFTAVTMKNVFWVKNPVRTSQETH
jgi:hypothetical protein